MYDKSELPYFKMLNPELRPELPFSAYPYSVSDIPETESMTGWKEVPVEESNQPLVCLNDLAREFPIRTFPQYFLQGIPNSLSSMYLREEAAKRLVYASMLLSRDYSLAIFDAFRPLEVQRSIFESFRNILEEQNPKLDKQEIIKMTETYVSLPSQDPSKPSPHATGGAIDLSIVGPDGLLDMGTEFDSFDIESQTSYLKYSKTLAYDNRKLLYTVMTSAGFTNYPEEWWHYDFGNQFWGFITNKPAIYGLAKGGDILGK